MSTPRRVFVAGATGVLGAALVRELVTRGHAVTALARRGSEAKVPAGARVVVGDVLDRKSWQAELAPGDVLAHLVGTPSPAPWRAEEFKRVDRGSLFEAVAAAEERRAAHIVYVSVAQPAPVMKSYIAMRAECEARIRASGIPATIVRPWYVLGPGRRWPIFLKPLYFVCERMPSTRAGALRLGFVTLAQMTRALANAVDDPPSGVRIVEVPDIRKA